MFLRFSIAMLLVVFMTDLALAQQYRPPRPLFSPKCSWFAMEYDEDINRWKCIFDKPLRRNYRGTKTESEADRRIGATTNTAATGQQQRDRQLQTEQEQRARQLQTEQEQRAERQRQLTQELIRDVQQRSRR
jgi:hypothetical protein